MTTPIILAVLLVTPLVIGGPLAAVFGKRRPPVATLAAAGLTLVFTFTGVGHFAKADGMVEMIPPWLPQREAAVFFSGVFELTLAAGFAFRRTRRVAAVAAVVFLVAVLPINVWAAINRTGLGGHRWGPVYLWIRVPLQGLLILWGIFAGRSSNDVSRGVP